MWKAPHRPADNQITQVFNDGLVTVYAVTDIAEPGYQPKPGLKKKLTLRYEEQRLGIQRLYSGRQNQVEIERVIRTPRAGDVNNQDVAVTEDVPDRYGPISTECFPFKYGYNPCKN